MCVWYGSGTFRRYQCFRRSVNTSGAIKFVGRVEVGRSIYAFGVSAKSYK